MTEMPSKQNETDAQIEDSSQGSSQPKLPKIISFSDLARCGDEVWLENNGELYRLQRTRNGKLIMTK